MQADPEPTTIRNLPPPGSVFAGQYRIVRLLGTGAFSAVYEAEHLILKRPVALKILAPDSLQDESSSKCFCNELQAISRLSHANIVHGLAGGLADGFPFITTELVRGRCLSELVKEALPDTETLKSIFDQIMNALEYAHGIGIVHRDLKPANIMLTDDGEIKVLDFGMAKIFASSPDGQTLDQGASQSGRFAGSPNYMSPEQIQGKRIDLRSDIYSLGLVAYELLAGHLPFESESSMHVMYQHLNAPVPPFVARKVDLDSGALNKVLQKCLQKNADNRYQTVAELHGDLIEALGATGKRTVIARITRQSIALLLIPFVLFGAIVFFGMRHQIADFKVNRPKKMAEDDIEAYGHRPMALKVGRTVVTPRALIYAAKKHLRATEHCVGRKEANGFLHEALTEYDDALALLEKHPDNYLLYMALLGRARCNIATLNRNEFVDRSGSLTSAGRMMTSGPLADLDRASTCIKENSYEDSVISCEKGKLYFAMGDYNKAESLFRHALKLKESAVEMSPSSAPYVQDIEFMEQESHEVIQNTYANLVFIAQKRHDNNAAEQYAKGLFNDLKTRDRYHYEAFELMSRYPRALLKNGKVDEAKRILELLEKEALKRPEQGEKANETSLLAELYYQAGDYDKARVLISSASEFLKQHNQEKYQKLKDLENSIAKAKNENLR